MMINIGNGIGCTIELRVMLGLLGAFVPTNKAPARPRRLSVVVGTR